MEDNINEFTKLHLKALRENTYYTLIYKDVNYENLFREAPSLESVYKIFFEGIQFEDGYELRLQLDDIVGFYLINKNNMLTSNDVVFLKKILENESHEYISEYINLATKKIKALKDNALSIGSNIQLSLSTIESYPPVEYKLTENNEERTFKIFMKNDDQTQREVNESDALFIFNKILPNSKYPVILYCNSVNKVIGNYSNLYPVDFTEDKILKIKLPPNSVSIMTKSGEYTTFDFELKTCVILINPTKVNDDKLKRINNFLPMLNLVEEKKSKRINGSISFVVDKVITYYNLFKYLITDDIASTLFYIDETARAWCSKDTFYVFFRDFSNEMINSSDIRTSENYFRITIPTQKKESITGFTINFTAKTKDMMPSFLHKFSRLISHFISLDNDTDRINVSIQGTKSKIFTKAIKALSYKASEFFKREGKQRGETIAVTPGDYYSRVCQAKIQPIIVEEEEIESWVQYGRQPVEFPPKEWGFDNSMWFVCPKETEPVINMKANKQDESGRLKFLPCCIGGQKSKSSSDIVVRNVNRKGMTELINSFGVIGTLNDALATFLAISFYKGGTYNFFKQGTIMENQEMTYLNSAIIALMNATGKTLHQSKVLNLTNLSDIEQNVKLFRDLMAKLPPDIYKQELYDMTDQEIVESILDPKTYIDPYLYYRGLEIIFDVQIFVFSSDIGRKNPISDEESTLNIPTLEVPRCKHTHIRHNNDNDIVCLYKNHGSINKISKIAPCELIIYMNPDNKIYSRKINSANKLFFNSMFNLLDKSCHPFEWDRSINDRIDNTCYENPYNKIDWNKYDLSEVGKIIGQEIDIYGKTTCLIFENWTMIIPPTQPLLILEPGTTEKFLTKEIKVKVGEIDPITFKRKEIKHKIFSGGVKKRPILKTLQAACEKFDFTAIDNDGIWLDLGGKPKGVKILCQAKTTKYNRTINSTIELIERKNNVSILMQIINWLWRSDWNGESFPNFILWWKEHTVIDDSVIFHTVPNPKINCNNIMLPTLDNFEQRIKALVKIWPFFFYRNKIHVSQELSERIENNFNIEDIYSRGLTPDDLYGEVGRFIVGLIPTDNDFVSNDNIILTKPEHVSDWINRNSSGVFKYKSLHNVMVIREKISPNLKNYLVPYIYKETIGDNVGKIYLIQNSSVISQPPELSCLGIANFWRTHASNPSHDYRVTDDTEFIGNQKYVLYRIGPNDLLEVFVDKSEGEDDYLQILCYDDGETFGSMLPIL